MSQTTSILKRLLKNYIGHYTSQIAVAIFWMIIGAIMTAFFAWLIGPVMDDIMVGGNREKILPLATILLVCILIRGGSVYLHTVKMGKVGHSLVADIQKDLFNHMLKLDLDFFQKNHSGSLVARVISDVQVMRGALADGLTAIGKNAATLVGLIGVMFYRDWVLAVAAFVIFPIAAYYVSKLGKKLRRISNRTQDAVATMTSGLAQSFQAIRQVRAFGRESFESKRITKTVENVRTLNIRNTRTGNLSTPMNDVLVGFTLFGIVTYGGYQVAEGQATAGAIMSFITAFLMAAEPMKKLTRLSANLNIGLGAAQRVLEILDTRPIVEAKTRKPKLKTKKSMDIIFDGVSFAYDDQPALKAIHFTAKAGEVTALVGPSGGGKSTILNMLMRFYDVTTGSVSVNNQDVRQVSLPSLRQSIGYVSQDIIIFADSVEANIAYGKEKATQKDIIKAAKAANAHDFIMGLPDGYDTILGEGGSGLSGGQKQRLALARAFLKDAPILLLDEATSALDTESESAVQKSLQKLQKGRTTLVIAHRLSTIRNADNILVIDDGKVIEQGSHASLIRKKDGAYKALLKKTGE